ncbi:MAG: sigma 54-interacting transcriptional regulator [Deltaproteobacteria bacterium]|nr:sigma 54-interacting transcriptional regulator [Deltaproteobacteria bacterium]
MGRSSGCTIQLLDEKVSRLHSTIHRDGDRFIVKDEGSSNGTGLNGRLLLESTELRPGDEVAIGNNLMLFNPDLEILRDLEGAGSVILATPPEASAAPIEDDRVESFRLEGLLASLSELVASPRGVGRPAALLEAAARGIGAERAALLVAPMGGEPSKAVATFPHRSRVSIARPLLQRVLDDRKAVRRAGTLDLTVRQGRSFIEQRAGAAIGLPIVLGGRLRAAFYADSSSPTAFARVPLDEVFSAINLAFAPLFAGDPALLMPAPEPEAGDESPLDSPAYQRVLEQARSAADQPTPVLLHGEPGSGREYVARQIHAMGPRAQGPFVALHSGSFSRDVAEGLIFGCAKGVEAPVRPGLVESANGGTVFFDDVGELPAHLQVKLLRLLQEGRVYRVGATRSTRVDVRVLAGSTRDLDTLVRGGVLREDLVDHLAISVIEVPPLRKRLADVAALVMHFIVQFEAAHGPLTRGFTPEALGLLEAQDWPGNVRELREVVRRVLIRARGEQVDGGDVRSELLALPSRSAFERSEDLGPAVRKLEAELASRALSRCRGSRARAARLMGIPVSELERRMVAWDIDPFGN